MGLKKRLKIIFIKKQTTFISTQNIAKMNQLLFYGFTQSLIILNTCITYHRTNNSTVFKVHIFLQTFEL